MPNDEVRGFPPPTLGCITNAAPTFFTHCFGIWSAVALILRATQAELERIDIKHHVIMLLMGGNLHLAPIVDPKTILDIGTGTGIWAMEMADRFPEATVIGTDLSPVQPMWYENIFHVRFGRQRKSVNG